jgi:hypothetical protein
MYKVVRELENWANVGGKRDETRIDSDAENDSKNIVAKYAPTVIKWRH